MQLIKENKKINHSLYCCAGGSLWGLAHYWWTSAETRLRCTVLTLFSSIPCSVVFIRNYLSFIWCYFCYLWWAKTALYNLVNVTQVYISFLMFVCNCVNPACLEQNADLFQVKAFSKTPTSFKMLTQKVVLDSFLKFWLFIYSLLHLWQTVLWCLRGSSTRIYESHLLLLFGNPYMMKNKSITVS